MELIYLINALLRKKWIIIACFLVAVITAFLFTRNSKTLYKSTAQIATGFTASEQIKLENENFNAAQIDVKFNNVIENLTSQKWFSYYRMILFFMTLAVSLHLSNFLKAINKVRI